MQKSWLFITYCSDPKRPYLDAAARYRCFDRAADLRGAGIQAAVISQQRFIRDPPMGFDRYVFHRPWFTQDFGALLNYLRRRGKRVFADYDAPVFAESPRGPVRPPFPEMISTSMPPVVRFRRALGLFEDVMAATEPLAERIRQEHPHTSVHVVESGLGAAWRELADALYMNARSARAEICVGIGDEVELDGALIGRLLPAVLERRPDLIFIVDAEVRRGLEAWGANVVERDESAGGLGTLARASALMLPASSSLWNVTASGIRALEAAYLDCPVLASPLPGWARHGGEGLQWIESEEQWIDALCAVGSAPTASKKKDSLLEQGVSAIHTRRMRECCG